MQCTVKLFEVPAQSDAGGLCAQKVAVKMSSKVAAALENDSGLFAQMMAALMTMPTASLDQPAPKLGWLHLEEGAKEWVPLIDLSNPESMNPNVSQMLMGAEPATDPTAATPSLFQQALTPPSATVSLDLAGEPAAVQGQGQNPGGSMASLMGSNNPKVADFIAADPQRPFGLQGNAAEAISIPPDLAAPMDASAASIVPEPAIETPDPVIETPDPEQMPLNSASPNRNAGPEISTAGSKQTVPAALFAHMYSRPGLRRALSQASERSRIVSDAPATEVKSVLKTVGWNMPAASKPAATPENPVGLGAKDSSASTPVVTDRPGMAELKARQADASQANAETLFGLPTDTTPDSAAGSGILRTEGPSTVHSHLKRLDTQGAAQVKGDADWSSNDKGLQTDVVRQIVQRMTLRGDGRLSQMNIKLKPEFLGNMHMEVMTENQQVSIRMTAENHKVREMVEQNIHLLKLEMQQHGLQVQKIDVFVSQDQDAWKNGQPQTAFRQSQDREHHQGGQREERQEGAAETAAATLMDSSGAARLKNGEVDFFA
jgi:flagellar hook-length control protein FliK